MNFTIARSYPEFAGLMAVAGPGEYVGAPDEDTMVAWSEEWRKDRLRQGQQKVEGGWKQDGGKARMDLIAPEMLVGAANVLAFGAEKYSERNWEKGMSWGRCFGALMRHMWAWWGGEKADPETGFSHLHHAACCLMFLIAYEERKTGTDDRKLPVDNSS